MDPSSNVQVAAALAEACRKARDPGAALLIRTLMTQVGNRGWGSQGGVEAGWLRVGWL